MLLVKMPAGLAVLSATCSHRAPHVNVWLWNCGVCLPRRCDGLLPPTLRWFHRFWKLLQKRLCRRQNFLSNLTVGCFLLQPLTRCWLLILNCSSELIWEQLDCWLDLHSVPSAGLGGYRLVSSSSCGPEEEQFGAADLWGCADLVCERCETTRSLTLY